MDTYTRIILTVIAAALVLIALRGSNEVITPAHAAEDISCSFSNALEISDFRDKLNVAIEEPLEVEVKQSFGHAGSSSGSPFYIKLVE